MCFNDMKTFHTRFLVERTDEKTIYMLKNIKHRYRNSFCKAVLRNALIQQNLTVFFSKNSAQYLIQLQGLNASSRNIQGFENTMMASSYKTIVKKTVFPNETVSAGNPFAGNTQEYNPMNFIPQSRTSFSAPKQPMAFQSIPLQNPVHVQPLVQEQKVTPVMNTNVPVDDTSISNETIQHDNSMPLYEKEQPAAVPIAEPIIESQKTVTQELSTPVSEAINSSTSDALDKLMGIMGNDFD